MHVRSTEGEIGYEAFAAARAGNHSILGVGLAVVALHIRLPRFSRRHGRRNVGRIPLVRAGASDQLLEPAHRLKLRLAMTE